MKRKGTEKIFTVRDCRRLAEGETYEDKFLVLSLDFFKPEYRNAQNQLFLAYCGFGCDPSKIGSKIFGRVYDENLATRDQYVLGVATEKAIQEWEAEYGMSRDVFFDEKKPGY